MVQIKFWKYKVLTCETIQLTLIFSKNLTTNLKQTLEQLKVIWVFHSRPTSIAYKFF